VSSNMYCPICLGELNEKLDCWIPCEYEGDYANLGSAPLTRKQMLNIRIKESTEELDSNLEGIKKLKENIKDYELELSTMPD